jgi:hypothetical protein
MKNIVFILFLLFTTTTFSQNYYSILPDEDWTTNSGWSNTSGGGSCTCAPSFQPGAGDSIFIETDVNLFGSLRLKAGSSLIITSGDTLYISGDAQFDNGSYLLIEPGGVLVIDGNLDNRNNSDEITIDGGLSVGGDLTNGSGGVISGTGNISVDGTVDNSGTIGGSTGDDLGALPIELIDFNATVSGKNVKIRWETASELNNLYFVVERSTNALLFDDIGTVMGAGNSNTYLKYSFTDTVPLNGVSYYRLTQVDYDGSSTSSNIISLARTNDMDSTLEFMVYPNPNNGDVVKIESLRNYIASQEILVIVLDMNGKIYYSKVILTKTDGSFYKAMDLHNSIPKGVYIVMGSSNNDIYSSILIIE